MTTQSWLVAQLRSELNPTHLVIDNESDSHSGPPNRETHFKVVCASAKFHGLSRVKRHQLVYGIAAEALEGGVHALALHLYSADEWSARSDAVPASPKCLGGE